VGLKPFDGTDYRKRVMARLLEDFALADPQTGDPFLVCDVDPADHSGVTEKHLGDLVAFWQKDRNHPRYKSIAAQMVARREQYAQVLLDPTRRGEAAARVLGVRSQADTEAFSRLDELTAPLIGRHGGIPRSRLPVLLQYATGQGVSREAFDAWCAKHPLIDDRDSEATPWEPAVRKQIRSALDELARSATGATASRYRTLLTFLAVGPKAPRAELVAAHARLVEVNKTRTRDRLMTVTEDLLAQISTRLLADGGVASYLASMRADAKDSVKGELLQRALLSGSLPAAELEAMAAGIAALEWGLTAADGRDLVREAAHDVHLAVEVGGEVDLIVCAGCHRPQPADGRTTCRYCKAELFMPCPYCNQTIPAATDVCPRCDASVAQWRAARAAMPAAQTQLDTGRPVEAGVIATGAMAGLDSSRVPAPLRALAAAAQDVQRRAAEVWRELRRDAHRGAVWAAAASATWLSRNASDVADPAVPDDGGPVRSAVDWLAVLKQQQATADAQVTTALKAPQLEVEAALRRVLRSYPDCPTAVSALARLPLPAPSAGAAQWRNGVAELSWRPAPAAPGAVRYRVERQVTWPAERVDRTTVGTTSTTHLEDASAPAGTVVLYRVAAVEGSRTSAQVELDEPTFVRRDVEVLHAEVVEGGINLSWPTLGLAGVDVVLERSVDPASGLSVPTRRIRPHEPGRYRDQDLTVGVPYLYRISLSYPSPEQGLIRTPGCAVAAVVKQPPRPVTELWASTDDRGRTTVSFVSPPAGTVRVYVGPGASAPFAGFSSGTLGELEAAASATELVGEGRRRVVDGRSRGAVTYQAVTVVEDDVEVGATLAHLASAKPTGLRVLADDGQKLRVTFDLPAGVTEAFVAWRRDRYPSVADATAMGQNLGGDGSGGIKVTNTKLEINGGLDISAAEDGRPLYVAVFPGVRAGSSGAAVPAPAAATLQARTPAGPQIRYQVRSAARIMGRGTKRVEVEVTEAAGRPLPALRLIGNPDHDPTGPDDGQLMAEHPGGSSSVQLVLEGDALPAVPVTLRLYAVAPAGATVEMVDPTAEGRRISR
jgi:hypothetical protein